MSNLGSILGHPLQRAINGISIWDMEQKIEEPEDIPAGYRAMYEMKLL